MNENIEEVDLSEFSRDELILILNKVCEQFAKETQKLIMEQDDELSEIKKHLWGTRIVSMAALIIGWIILT
jgi:hypothetical protein